MSYIRKTLQKFEAYIPGEQPQDAGWIKLNTNENPYPPSPKVVQALKRAASDPLNLYPDALCKSLRKAIAKTYRLNQNQIICGNGSDEILRLILSAFLNPGEKVLYPSPSYPLYQTLAQLSDGKTREIPLTDNFDFPEWKDEWQGKILFIPNPNSPTGGYFSEDKISLACEKFKGLVVIDEAYADFAQSSALPLLKKYSNLIVCRTFSKSYSLAGMRLGYAVSSPDIINGFYMVKDSYNVNRLSQVAAQAALEDKAYFKNIVSKVINSRQKLVGELEHLGFKVLPSEANFVFASPPDKNGKSLYQYLKKKKILVRYWDRPRLSESVRITVGTEEEITSLVDALKKY